MIKKSVVIIGAVLFFINIYAQEKEIENIFREINQLIASKNIDSILEFYDPKNQDFMEQARQKYKNTIKLDSLSYTTRLNDLFVEKDTAIGVVFEKKNYFKNERRFYESQWYTYSFIKTNNKWFINKVEERNYLKADYATINVTIDPDSGRITGKAEIDLSVLKEGEDNILFSLNRGLKIHNITDEKGKELEYRRSGMEVLIPCDDSFKGQEELRLAFSYSGTLFNEYAEYNYCLAYIGKEGCFANFVTDWYPKINSTLTKSKAKLIYNVPSELTVASVGVLTDKKEKGNRCSYTYTVNKPMDYTFNANKFTSFNKKVDDISVNVYFFDNNPQKAEMYANKAAQLVSFLSEFYGIFPYDSYSISEVPSEITMDLGGSGGQGLNFYPETALRDTVFEFPLLAHEIGHMWWGSWVAGKENTGALFSEGFAQFSPVICYRHFYGEKAMWNFLNHGTINYPQSAKLYFQRYSSNDIPLGNYDVNRSSDLAMLARVKAHFVYTMLMEHVGYSFFQKGIRRVVKEYANRQIGLNEFKHILEEESGLNLNTFFEQWFFRSGAPEFALEYAVTQRDDGRYIVSGLVTQKREIYTVDAEIELAYDDYRTVKRINLSQQETPFSFVTIQKPQAVIFDPDRKILRWSENTKYLPVLEKGMMSLAGGKNKEAIVSLKKYYDLKPFDAIGNGLLGIAYINSKQYDKAIKYLLYAEEMYAREGVEKFHRILLNLALGEYYFEKEKVNKARPYFEKVTSMIDFMGSHARANSYLEKID